MFCMTNMTLEKMLDRLASFILFSYLLIYLFVCLSDCLEKGDSGEEESKFN